MLLLEFILILDVKFAIKDVIQICLHEGVCAVDKMCAWWWPNRPKHVENWVHQKHMLLDNRYNYWTRYFTAWHESS